jgi:hypothetical protein
MGAITAILVATAACGRARAGHVAPSCTEPPTAPVAPLPPSLVEQLAGDYEFIVIAKSGPRKGAVGRGRLHLELADDFNRYNGYFLKEPSRRAREQTLLGWTNLDADLGIATAGVPLDSHDHARPGVSSSLDTLRSGLTLMLGYRPMLDGGGNEFDVTRISPSEVAGRWSSSLGYTTYHAGGYFCAIRSPAPP